MYYYVLFFNDSQLLYSQYISCLLFSHTLGYFLISLDNATIPIRLAKKKTDMNIEGTWMDGGQQIR